MNTLIQAICNWLVTDHTITMAGWAWLCWIPGIVIVLLLTGYVGFYVLFAAIWRGPMR